LAGGISPSVLLGWFQSFYGGSGTGGSALANSLTSGGSATPPILYAPTPPWQAAAQPAASQLVRQALSGAQLFNASSVQVNLPGASADYKNLFALYSGLNSLQAIANAATAKNVTSLQVQQLSQAFAAGLNQLSQYLSKTSFSQFKLTAGVVQSTQTSSATTPQQQTSYVTPALNTTGDSAAVVPAFEGNVQFTVTAQVGQNTTTVPIDLSALGSTPRTIGNVVAYLNSQLKAAGVLASFSIVVIPPKPDTITVGGKTVTVSPGAQSWALKLNTSPIEQVTLSAPTTSPAVYLGQIAGNQTSSTGPTGASVPPDAQSQLIKIDTGGGVTSPNPPAFAAPGQIFTDQLGASVSSVQATAVAPDGSVYVLANVTPASGSTSVSGQDVALQKYDAAGHLLFSANLGSASNASGLSLAVSADGSQVAIAGQATGPLTAGQTINDPTGAHGFVAVFDSLGNQVWRQENDSLTPSQASGVAFGANGTVYVTGRAQATAGAQGAEGPSNSFLQVYSSSGTQVSSTQIAAGGVNTSAGVAVSGSNVYVAGVQNGDAVVSEYDVTNPAAPTLVATRDLGNLQGGAVVGVAVQNGQVLVAGSARGGALNAGAVTSPASGSGLNGFAVALSPGLAPAGSDSVAYYGGSGDARVTAATFAGGDVYLTGAVTGSLPNEPAIGAQDGFIAALNPSTGSVDYAQHLTGLDGRVAPTSIAVAPTGGSVLDQLGLPAGVVNGPVSSAITSTTGVKAGDSFQIAVGGAPAVTVTVKAGDTFASLATEISQATGFNVKVSTTPGPNGTTALEIKPLFAGVAVRLIDGPAGADALAELGLKPGLVVDTATKNGVTTLAGVGTPVYGLGLPVNLDLSSAADIQNARVHLAGAIAVVEQAYQNLANAATPPAVLALQKLQANGTRPPLAIANQIANYQSALQRLTAGQSQTSTITLANLF
jgi:hypothetical protein